MAIFVNFIPMVSVKMCSICGKPVGVHDHPHAEVSHNACVMERVYGEHGRNPAEGRHAQVYADACKMRKKQIGG